MFKKTKGYSSGGKVKSKGMKNGGVMKSKGMKNGGVMKSKGYKTGGKVQKSSNAIEERIKNSIFDPKPTKGPKPKSPKPKRSKEKWAMFTKKTPNESKIRKGPGR
tara:strand:- start:64 stop:378 length:315 start_codon:yes stop_codon:yes gene_type:complete